MFNKLKEKLAKRRHDKEWGAFGLPVCKDIPDMPKCKTEDNWAEEMIRDGYTHERPEPSTKAPISRTRTFTVTNSSGIEETLCVDDIRGMATTSINKDEREAMIKSYNKGRGSSKKTAYTLEEFMATSHYRQLNISHRSSIIQKIKDLNASHIIIEQYNDHARVLLETIRGEVLA